jgi:hypothetical protein
MDQRDIELSKLNFLLENLYALVLQGLGATPDDVETLATEMVNQCRLPASTFGAAISREELLQGQEMLAQRLDLFFAGVRQRISTDRGL